MVFRKGQSVWYQGVEFCYFCQVDDNFSLITHEYEPEGVGYIEVSTKSLRNKNPEEDLFAEFLIKRSTERDTLRCLQSETKELQSIIKEQEMLLKERKNKADAELKEIESKIKGLEEMLKVAAGKYKFFIYTDAPAPIWRIRSIESMGKENLKTQITFSLNMQPGEPEEIVCRYDYEDEGWAGGDCAFFETQEEAEAFWIKKLEEYFNDPANMNINHLVDKMPERGAFFSENIIRKAKGGEEFLYRANARIREEKERRIRNLQRQIDEVKGGG
jgi:hypothetical protein